jgi:hypothetical protein
MYNTIFKYAAFVMLTCVLASCWNEEPEATLPTAFVVVGDLSNIPVAGGVYYLTISSPTPVEVTSSEPWCKTEISENGAKVTIEPNLSVNARAATVLVKGVVNVSKPAIQVGAPKLPVLVGNWQFPASNILAANIGADLESKGAGIASVPGPDGSSAVTVPLGSYFLAKHGITPVGTKRVNDYTLLFDYRQPATGKWYTFYQTDLTNSNDGEAFIRPNNGLGVGSYSPTIPEDLGWHRLVITCKLPDFYRYYIDGEFWFELGTSSLTVDDRFSLDVGGVLIFCDESGEDADIDVAEITIWDQALTDAEVATIGKVGDPYLP